MYQEFFFWVIIALSSSFMYRVEVSGGLGGVEAYFSIYASISGSIKCLFY